MRPPVGTRSRDRCRNRASDRGACSPRGPGHRRRGRPRRCPLAARCIREQPPGERRVRRCAPSGYASRHMSRLRQCPIRRDDGDLATAPRRSGRPAGTSRSPRSVRGRTEASSGVAEQPDDSWVAPLVAAHAGATDLAPRIRTVPVGRCRAAHGDTPRVPTARVRPATGLRRPPAGGLRTKRAPHPPRGSTRSIPEGMEEPRPRPGHPSRRPSRRARCLRLGRALPGHTAKQRLALWSSARAHAS